MGSRKRHGQIQNSDSKSATKTAINVEAGQPSRSEEASSVSSIRTTEAPETLTADPNKLSLAPVRTLFKLRGSSTNTVKSRSLRGWSGGTWPRKSSPSTQVARESILASKSQSGTSTADYSRFEHKKSDTLPPASAGDGKPPLMSTGKSQDTVVMSTGDASAERISSTKPKASVEDAEPDPSGAKQATQPTTASGWRGWVGYHGTAPAEMHHNNSTALPKTSPVEFAAEATVVEEAKLSSESSGSWFGFWPSGKPKSLIKEEETQVPIVNSINPEASGGRGEEESRMPESVDTKTGGSWGFFFTKQLSRPDEMTANSTEGELAVSGKPSQDNPTRAHTVPIVEEPENLAAIPAPKKKEKVQKLSPLSVAPTDNQKTPGKVLEPSAATEAASSVKSSPAPTIVQPKTNQANLLLPSFRTTYQLKENPSILQQITRLLLHNHAPLVNHVYRLREPPRIKKALAIGIHGLFPASFLRPVIGQPTGTSIRFANHAADAIQRWTDAQGFDCEIEKVALEGEGKIAERVDNLWKLLLNWVDHVRQADFILIACHSQGVPVAIMLAAKLIEFGVVSTGKIGVAAMAGVSIGPFADYKARFFGGSTAELFDFADAESEVSKRYEQSLRTALKYGVRVTYVGSIDDQLVSLESAIFSPVSHPYIYRAVFVDGRVHAPDFIAHLVGFCLKLRNLGVEDHGLIRELSAPLAGSLYTGQGHSSLYDETRIYDLAIEFALETSTIDSVPLVVKKYTVASSTSTNPFQLPWSMRGLLEEDVVKTELDEETKALLKQFDEWKPTTKGLKDVKYRLEAVRSKL